MSGTEPGITYLTHGACKPIHNLWHCGVGWRAPHYNMTRASALTSKECVGRIREIRDVLPRTKVLVLALSPESTDRSSPTYQVEVFALTEAAIMGIHRIVLLSEEKHVRVLRSLRTHRSSCVIAVPQASLTRSIARIPGPPSVQVVEGFAAEKFVPFSREISQLFS